MTSSLVDAFHTRQGARKRNRYGAERNPQRGGYFAITEALGPQRETAAVLSGRSAQNRLHACQPLAAGSLFLRVGSSVRLPLGRALVWIQRRLGLLVGGRCFNARLCATRKIQPRRFRRDFPTAGAGKERQENLLDDLFSVVHRQSKRDHVTKQRVTEHAQRDG